MKTRPAHGPVEACHQACTSLRLVIAELQNPTLKRSELARKLGSILLTLEGAAYPTISDGTRTATTGRDPRLASREEDQRGQVDLLKLATTRPMPVAPPAGSSHRTPGQIALARATDEMKRALAAFADPAVKVLKIRAPAGAGKTTLLTAMAEQNKGTGLYCAFNKDIVADSKGKFPSRVQVRNWHAIAFSIVGAQYEAAGKPIRDFYIPEIIQLLNLSRFERPATLAYQIRETLGVFLNQTDDRVTRAHIKDEAITRFNNRLRREGMRPAEANIRVQEYVQQLVELTQMLWDMSYSKANLAPMPHDGYLWVWAKSKPTINADFVLVDECQDTTPVMASILALQTCKLVLVGDPYQAIYGFKGGSDIASKMPGTTVQLTKSFRFGPNIAAAANRILELRGEKDLIKGCGPTPGEVGRVNQQEPFTVICRTNAALCVRAAEYLDHHKTAIVGGITEILALMRSAHALYTGNLKDNQHPILREFKTYRDLQEHAEASGESECRLMVRLLEEQGGRLEKIMAKLESNLVPESEAHVILTTCHKVKGREFDQVLIDDDFPDLRDPKTNALRIDEVHLLHVAATRARKVLEPCNTLAQLLIRFNSQPTTRTSSDLGLVAREIE